LKQKEIKTETSQKKLLLDKLSQCLRNPCLIKDSLTKHPDLTKASVMKMITLYLTNLYLQIEPQSTFTMLRKKLNLTMRTGTRKPSKGEKNL